MNNNKVILLITTNGCKGCSVQLKSLKEAIKLSHKTIHFEIQDISEMTKQEIAKWRKKRIFLKDFPTTIFINDDIITFKTEGSLPSIVNLMYIDLYLK